MGHAVTDGRRLARVSLLIALSAGMAVAQSCATASSQPRAVALASAEASVERVAERVLAGLAAGDAAALSRLVVTKDEFCTAVFPELPSSKVRNVSCDFVWEMAMLNHASGFREVFDRHKGKRYALESLRFGKPAQAYPSFRVHKEPYVTVRDEGGAAHEYRLFGDVLEMNGQFKLFGFMVD